MEGGWQSGLSEPDGELFNVAPELYEPIDCTPAPEPSDEEIAAKDKAAAELMGAQSSNE